VRAAAVVFLLAGLALGCGDGEAPDPVVERLAASADPRAATIVRRMLQAYGGHPAWARLGSVEYAQRLEFHGGRDEPQIVTRQRHRFTLGTPARVRLEDLDSAEPQVISLVDDVLQVTRAGAPVTDPEQLGFPRAFAGIVWQAFRQPWNLLDPGAEVAIRSPRTPPPAGRVVPEICDVVRFTEKPPDRREASDWQDFYIGRLSHLVDRVHSYRAEDGAYRVTVWSDHRRFGDVRVATRRATYTSDVTGMVGPLEVVVEYADIRFGVPVEVGPAAEAARPAE
jgi:hypothetical protein